MNQSNKLLMPEKFKAKAERNNAERLTIGIAENQTERAKLLRKAKYGDNERD